MPTPSDSTDELPLQVEHPLHATCPPENDRHGEWRVQVLDRLGRAASDTAATAASGSPRQEEQPQIETDGLSPMAINVESANTKASDQTTAMDISDPSPLMRSESPLGFQADDKEGDHVQSSAPLSSALDLQYSHRFGINSTRLIQTHTSSMLRAGSKFRGTQTSDAQKYNVEVDIKTVDTSESFICGYLKIEGLTPEHATLTTYFEGEIIGPKYTFQTRHESWGASDKDDMRHWARFTAWRPLAKQAKKSADFHYKNSTNRENMFMRWKEKFLVPDHRVREISGASFEGFYYICFNQAAGTISGQYYHSRSDSNSASKLQQLELEWKNDHGCFSGTEFR